MNLAELRERRNRVFQAMDALYRLRENESDGDFTPEDLAAYDRLQREYDELSVRIGAEEAKEAPIARAIDRGRRHAEMAREIAVPRRKSDPIELAPTAARRGTGQFSILRAIRGAISRSGLQGYELEYQQEMRAAGGRSRHDVEFDEGSQFFVPWDLPLDRRASGNGSPERRDFDTTAGAGGLATMTDSTMIEFLRNNLLMGQLGAKFMSDMANGGYTIPKQTGTGTVSWVAEGGTGSESQAAVGQVAFNPDGMIVGYTDLSRRVIYSSSYDAELLVREDLSGLVAVELDRVGWNGSGSGVVPLGIIQNSSCPTVAIGTNGGPPTWAAIVSLKTNVTVANVLNGKRAYVTTGAGEGKLKQTLIASAAASDMIWSLREDRINGAPAYSTEQIPSNLTKGSSGAVCSAVVYGAFENAAYAIWGPLDILVNPYSNDIGRLLRISVAQTADFNLRRPEAFSKIVDMTTT